MRYCVLVLKKTKRRMRGQKEKSVSVAVSDAQISRRIAGWNKTSHASPHESSSVGRSRESFVQVLANI
jgi:hypothetical protein